MYRLVSGEQKNRLLSCNISDSVELAPFLNAQNVINVPADQPTIQAGINAANNGDTVQVAAGTYAEKINFVGKAIVVTSTSGPSATIIDGGANGTVVTFANGETTSAQLSGFTIRNGYQNGLSGGGILITGGSPMITGNVITGNHAAAGRGIYVNGGSPVIKNNTITANDQTGAGSGGAGGGGIAIAGSNTSPAAPQIIGNTITNNSVANGGDGGGDFGDLLQQPVDTGQSDTGEHSLQQWRRDKSAILQPAGCGPERDREQHFQGRGKWRRNVGLAQQSATDDSEQYDSGEPGV